MEEARNAGRRWTAKKGTITLYALVGGLVWVLGVSGVQSFTRTMEGGVVSPSVAVRLADKACADPDFRAAHGADCAALKPESVGPQTVAMKGLP